MSSDDDLSPPHHGSHPFDEHNKLKEDKKIFEGLKYDFDSNKDFNKDLDLLPHLKPRKEGDLPVCKPDGMLIGQNNPFFKEERYREKNIPPNVKYDIIGPYGTEVNPDLETYPLHTSKNKKDDLPDITGNLPNFNPGKPGGFGNFGKFF